MSLPYSAQHFIISNVLQSGTITTRCIRCTTVIKDSTTNMRTFILRGSLHEWKQVMQSLQGEGMGNIFLHYCIENGYQGRHTVSEFYIYWSLVWGSANHSVVPISVFPYCLDDHSTGRCTITPSMEVLEEVTRE